MTHLPRLGLGLALLLGSSLASAESYQGARSAVRHCLTETSWVEQVTPTEWRAVCGDELGERLYDVASLPGSECWRERDDDGVWRTYCPSSLCAHYAAWAAWAFEHGLPSGGQSSPEAADAALEECGGWQ